MIALSDAEAEAFARMAAEDAALPLDGVRVCLGFLDQVLDAASRTRSGCRPCAARRARHALLRAVGRAAWEDGRVRALLRSFAGPGRIVEWTRDGSSNIRRFPLDGEANGT